MWGALLPAVVSVGLLAGGILVVGVVQPVAVAAAAQAVPVGSAQASKFYSCSDGTSFYTVPGGVTALRIGAGGAGGGEPLDAGFHSNGGAAGVVQATVPVTAGQRLVVTAGCTAPAPSHTQRFVGAGGAGFSKGGNGGGNGSFSLTFGGGGGGSSGVALCASGTCSGATVAQADVLVVAGGGGGAGEFSQLGGGGYGGSGGRNPGNGGLAGSVDPRGGRGGGAPGADGQDGANGAGGGGGGGYPRGGGAAGGGDGGGGGMSYTTGAASSVAFSSTNSPYNDGWLVIAPVAAGRPVPQIARYICGSGDNDAQRTLTVPANVTRGRVFLQGGPGALGPSSPYFADYWGGTGGLGTRLDANLTVAPNDKLLVTPGCPGGGPDGHGTAGGSGFGNGGNGGRASTDLSREGTPGGGGGGASAVVRQSDKTLLAVAGGGGGGGGTAGSPLVDLGNEQGGNGGAGSRTGETGQSGSSDTPGYGGPGGPGGSQKGANGAAGTSTICWVAGAGGGGGGGVNGGGPGGQPTCQPGTSKKTPGFGFGGGGGGGGGSSTVDPSASDVRLETSGTARSLGMVMLVWSPDGPPGSPYGVTATPVNSGATVSFSPPADDGGSPITGYLITAQPGGKVTRTRSTQAVDVVGLTNATTYTFTVQAVSALGTGQPSAPSNPVTPVAPPGKPTVTTVTPGDGRATVAFTPPTTGGPVTSYTAIARAGSASGPGITTTGPSSPLTLTGLTNGTGYLVTVYATNAGGDGPESSPSPVVPLAPPGAPTNVQASAGDGKATVTFTPPANAATTGVTSYTVTASPGGATVTAGVSPVTVTGLTNGTAYTFTVHATNAAGNGPESAPSPPVTPATGQTPSPPLLPRAIPGNQQVTVSFTASLSDGGSPINSYTVTATPGGQTATGPASPITVTGLANGTSYTFTVVATNAAGGTSQPSTPSAPVTPGAGQADNDMFANAQPISGDSGTVTGSNVNATKEPGEPNHNNDPGGASIWYWWTGPGGAVTFDTCGSSFPTVIGVYQGSAVNALTPVNVERGIQPCGDGSSAPSVVFNVAPGDGTFQIAIDGVNTGTGPATGSVTLRWRHAG